MQPHFLMIQNVSYGELPMCNNKEYIFCACWTKCLRIIKEGKDRSIVQKKEEILYIYVFFKLTKIGI